VPAKGKAWDQSWALSRAQTRALEKGKVWGQLKEQLKVAMWWALQLKGRAKVLQLGRWWAWSRVNSRAKERANELA